MYSKAYSSRYISADFSFLQIKLLGEHCTYEHEKCSLKKGRKSFVVVIEKSMLQDLGDVKRAQHNNTYKLRADTVKRHVSTL